MPATIPAIAMVPLAVPTAAAASPAHHTTEGATHSAQAVHSDDLTSGLASASIGFRSSSTDRPSDIAGGANTTAPEATERTGAAGQRGNVASPVSPGKFSSLISRQAESSTPDEDVFPAGSAHEQAGGALATAAPDRTAIGIEHQPSTPPGSQEASTAAAPVISEGVDRLPLADGAVSSESGQSPALPPIAGKPESVGSSKAATQNTARTAHGAGKLDSIQQGSHAVEGQVSASAVEVAAMARNLSAARGAVSTAGGTAGSMAAAESGAGETFAALDAESAPGKPTWIHAGAQRAEVGFEDPALGWVGIRADLSGGGVHAAVVPGSIDAAETLGSHLAGLNTYLAEHHTAVEAVTLAAPQGGWTDSGQGTGQAMHQGPGQQSGQETAQGALARSRFGPSDGSAGTQAVSSGLPAGSGEASGSVQGALPGSMHISVIA
jgi:hypothetical protein